MNYTAIFREQVMPTKGGPIQYTWVIFSSLNYNKPIKFAGANVDEQFANVQWLAKYMQANQNPNEFLARCLDLQEAGIDAPEATNLLYKGSQQLTYEGRQAFMCYDEASLLTEIVEAGEALLAMLM